MDTELLRKRTIDSEDDNHVSDIKEGKKLKKLKVNKKKDTDDDDDILVMNNIESTKKVGYNGRFRNLKKHTAIWSSDTPVKGLFITCDQQREGNSVGEMDSLLKGFAEKYLPKLTNTTINNNSNKGEEKEDKKELKIFNFINSGCSGSYFVSISHYPDLNPTDFVNSIFVDIFQRKIKKVADHSPYRLKLKYILDNLPETTKKMIKEADQSVIIPNKLIAKIKFTHRLLPIIETSVSGKCEVTEMSKRVISKLNEINPKTFAIDIKSRNNLVIDKKELVKEVAGYVNPDIKVNLKKPEYTVVIEIIKSSVVMGIVNLFDDLYKYNIKELCKFNPMDELKQKPEIIKSNNNNNNSNVDKENKEN